MTEPGSSGDMPNNVADSAPKLPRDPIECEIGTAAEFFRSPDRAERILAAEAVKRAVKLGVDNPQDGIRLSRLLRVRAIAEGMDDTKGSGSHRVDEEVRRTLARYEALVGNVHDVILDIDEGGYISFINPAITELTGYSVEDLTDIRFDQIMHPDDTENVAKVFKDALEGASQKVEFRVLDINGNIKWVRATSHILVDKGTPCGINVRMNDITEIKELQKELTIKSEHDKLTGLFNRLRAEDEMAMLEREGRRKKRFPVSILYIDVDNFKSINDNQSHAVGDAALREVASLLGLSMKDVHAREDEDYIIARFGGDEFLMILQKTDADQAQKIRNRINIAFENADCPDSVNPTVSIGVATAESSDKIKTALQAADDALGEIQDVKRTKREKDKLEPQL